MWKKMLPMFAASLLLIPSIQALAGESDSSKPVICAVIETHECDPNADCQRGSAESINVPQFFKVNFKDELITSVRASGEVQTSPIQRMERADGSVFLQGIQNGRAWSAAIKGENGRFVLTASGNDEAFVILGACTDEYD